MKKIFTTVFLIVGVFISLSLSAQVRVTTPVLSLPADSAIGQMPDVVLDWNPVSGGPTSMIKYDIQIDLDPAFSAPVNFETELVSGVQMDELLFGEYYYWRVRAKDGGDVSEWSEVWSFRVISNPVITKPIDGSEQSTEPVLEWKEITGILAYEYQIDTVYYWGDTPNFTDKDIFGISALAADNAFVVGAAGTVYHFDGTAWNQQSSSTTKDLLDVFALDASNVWAVGKGGTIIYFNGTTWVTQTSGSTKDLVGVYFVDATNGWAVGASGTILRFNGTDWITETSGTTDGLNSVYFLDGSNGWAVGKAGVILHFDGSSWTSQESGVTRELLSVVFSGPNNGWVSGKLGTLLYFDGTAWSTYVHDLTTKDITAIRFADETTAWACGKTGTMLFYNGAEWTKAASGTNEDLNDVQVLGTAAGWAVGKGGKTVVYSPDAFTSPFAMSEILDGKETKKSLMDMLFGVKFYWRIRAIHSQDTSDWSAPSSFNVVASPTLSKPTSGSNNVHLNVSLEWKKVANHVTYDIEIDDDPAFPNPLFFSTEALKITAEQLSFGTTYYWRVRAAHSKDISDWSEAWTFNTVNTVALYTPANGAVDVQLSPKLTWEVIGGAGHYGVQVANENTFAEPIVDSVVDANGASFIVPVILQKNMVYYWRVNAINGLDSTNWSQTWSFTTIPPVGIDDPSKQLAVKIYPNPAKDVIFIQSQKQFEGNIELTITDLTGKEMIRKNFIMSGNNSQSIKLDNFAEGIYFIKLDNGTNSLINKLVISK